MKTLASRRPFFAPRERVATAYAPATLGREIVSAGRNRPALLPDVTARYSSLFFLAEHGREPALLAAAGPPNMIPPRQRRLNAAPTTS